MPHKDKQERKEYAHGYHKKWYAENKAQFRQKKDERLLELREWMLSFKMSLACTRCGNDDYRVLEFHHIDPTRKEINPSRMVANGWSIKRMQEELMKCEPLCANCHKIEHYR